MNVDNIQALIAQKKIVELADIIPTEAYVQLGVFQHGNRQNGAGNANTYAPYIIPVSELIIPSGSDVIVANTAFVAKNGNDGTAVIGNLSKPFLTIEAAHAAAVAGTSIYVFAGNYIISTGLYKSEVVGYHFEPGVNINCIAAWMFNGNILGLGLNLNVTGAAIINCNGGFVRSPEGVGSSNINITVASVTWNTNLVFVYSNATSNISITVLRDLTGGFNAGLTYVDAPATFLEINCPYIYTSFGNILINALGSSTVINASQYNVNSTSPFASQANLNTSGSKVIFNCGIMNINALNNDGQGVFFINGSGGKIEINSEINHTAGVTLARGDAGEIIFNKPIFSALGIIYAASAGAKIYINSDFVTGFNAYYGSVATESGAYIFIGPYLIRNTANLPAIYNNAGGNIALSGTRVIADTALVPPIDNSGTIQIAGEVLQNRASAGAAPVSGTLTTLAGVF